MKNARPLLILIMSIVLFAPFGFLQAQSQLDIADRSARVLENLKREVDDLKVSQDKFLNGINRSMLTLGEILQAMANVEEGSDEQRYLASLALLEVTAVYKTLNETVPGYLRQVESFTGEVSYVSTDLRNSNVQPAKFDLQRERILKRFETCAKRERDLLLSMRDAYRRNATVSDDLLLARRDANDCMIEQERDMISLNKREDNEKALYGSIGQVADRLNNLSRRTASMTRGRFKDFTSAIRSLYHKIGGRSALLAPSQQKLVEVVAVMSALEKNAKAFNDAVVLLGETAVTSKPLITLGTQMSGASSGMDVSEGSRVIIDTEKRLGELDARSEKMKRLSNPRN